MEREFTMIFEKYGMEHSTSVRSKLTVPLAPALDTKGETTSNWDFV